jgi:hypothetical protein
VTGYEPTPDETALFSQWLTVHDHHVLRRHYETVQALPPVILENIQGEPAAEWLAKHDREVAAKAWDEGYREGHADEAQDYEFGSATNPYREVQP